MFKNKINNIENDSKDFNCDKQITRLYTSSVLGGLSLTGAWVAILAARGFSLVEIGIVETVFHITSLLFEIPSGVLADVVGRKKMLVISTIIVNGLIKFIVLTSLIEVGGNEERKRQQVFGSIKSELIKCFVESLAFLKSARKSIFLMFCNSFVGAIDILLLFFLQAKLLEAGMPSMLLGVALFVMQLGGIIGARVILFCKKMSYRTICIVTMTLFCESGDRCMSLVIKHRKLMKKIMILLCIM